VRTSEDPTSGATNSTDSAGSRAATSASRAACGRADSQAFPGGVLDIGSHVPGWPARRSPPADRQERDVDVPGEPCHPGVEGRIAGEVDARGPLDQEAKR